MTKEENKPKKNSLILITSGGEVGLGVLAAHRLREEHGNDLVIISPEDYEKYYANSTILDPPHKTFKITAIEHPFTPPLTRRERREKERKSKSK